MTIFLPLVTPDSRPSALARLPDDGEPLDRAVRASRAAATVGFDWPSVGPVFAAVRSELGELEEALSGRDPRRVSEELGDVLLAVTNLARHLSVSPTGALEEATDRFVRRFEEMERQAWADGAELADLGPDELEDRWQRAKRSLAREERG